MLLAVTSTSLCLTRLGLADFGVMALQKDQEHDDEDENELVEELKEHAVIEEVGEEMDEFMKHVAPNSGEAVDSKIKA